MSTLIAIFTLSFALSLQTTLVVNMRLLNGTADVVLLCVISWILHENTQGKWIWGIVASLFVGFVSELPIWVVMIDYLIIIYIIQLFQTKIWQAPMVILFVSTTIGSILLLVLNAIYLLIIGVPLPLLDSLNLVILPSVILNIIFILPVYALMGEIVKKVYPTGNDQ